MEGDDILLAEVDTEAEEPQKRDEWMTTLPPERKVIILIILPETYNICSLSLFSVVFLQHGITTQSTKAFSQSGKEGRGDTSIWTDNPLEKAQKAKQRSISITLT